MEKSKTEFFLCLYKESGNHIGHSISVESEFPETLKAIPERNERIRQNIEREEKVGTGEELKSPFERIFKQFSNSMLGYMEILPTVSSLIPSMSTLSTVKSIGGFAEKYGRSVESCEGYDLYVVEIGFMQQLVQLMQRLQTASMVGRQIPKMLIMGIVSSYEHNFSLLVREIFKKYPEKLENSKREFTIKDVFQSASIEEFREAILEKEMDNILRESFVEQVKWIEKNLSISEPISEAHKSWDDLVEVFERRNIYAHANGIVNSHYLKRPSEAKKRFKAEKGKELRANSKYINSSTELICEFGIKLMQVAWRKMEKENEERASECLGDLGYELILQGKYRLAAKILEFAKTLRGNISEQRKRIDLINLASAYKLMKDVDKSSSLIKSVDWEIANYEFQISVAAVLDNDEKVISLMEAVSKSEKFSDKYFEEWPVFNHLRENENFKNEFERIYGRKLAVAKKSRGVLFDALIDAPEKDKGGLERKETATETKDVLH